MHDDDYDDDYREEAACRYCNGRGYLTADSGGAGPAYHCPDCTEYEEDGDDCDE